jgi:short-subunit dehydrogenase
MATRTVLVTGATAGIGAAFVRRLGKDGYDLVVVARDAERLEGVAEAARSDYRVGVQVLPADLSTDAGRDLVAQRLQDADRPVDMLVNSAGLSLNKSFLRSTAEKETQMLSLNIHAVMRLTLAALPGMVVRRHGAVINVSSVAGFGVSNPGSTYPATKAWVTNFTESIAPTVATFGVRMMALCPGFVRTEFHQRAGINMSKAPDWLWLDADELVADAMRDLRRGKVVSVPNWKYKLAALGLQHLPRPLVRRMARGARGRMGRGG